LWICHQCRFLLHVLLHLYQSFFGIVRTFWPGSRFRVLSLLCWNPVVPAASASPGCGRGIAFCKSPVPAFCSGLSASFPDGRAQRIDPCYCLVAEHVCLWFLSALWQCGHYSRLPEQCRRGSRTGRFCH